MPSRQINLYTFSLRRIGSQDEVSASDTKHYSQSWLNLSRATAISLLLHFEINQNKINVLCEGIPNLKLHFKLKGVENSNVPPSNFQIQTFPLNILHIHIYKYISTFSISYLWHILPRSPFSPVSSLSSRGEMEELQQASMEDTHPYYTLDRFFKREVMCSVGATKTLVKFLLSQKIVVYDQEVCDFSSNFK